MRFHVMTLFPDMVAGGLGTSITGRAIENHIFELNIVNIRDYSRDKHKHVDDYPYGGGAGMVMQPGPVYDCYQDIVKDMNKKPRVIYMTPQGKVFNQAIAEELSREEELIFLCGHYEGIDERVLEEIVTDEVSIGDYVLTGGELPAMVMIDSISRLIPGVLNNDDSAEYESFQDGLLEYPQYTRPETFMDKKVPPVLLSGHHGNIEKWRREESLKRTLLRRPELLETAELTKDDKKILEMLMKMNDIIKNIEAAQLKAEVPEFHVGDTVRVSAKVKEGSRERIQVFEGTVIKRQNGSSRETFTVRKNSNGIGVEKTWPLHSPIVEKIEVVRRGKVRRAKLFYLRDRVGKKAKVKELVK